MGQITRWDLVAPKARMSTMLLIKATDYGGKGGGTEAVNTLVRRLDGAGGGPALPQCQGTIGAMDNVPMEGQAGSGPAAEPGA